MKRWRISIWSCLAVMFVAFAVVSDLSSQPTQPLSGKIIFTQAPNGGWGWQVADPGGEFLASSPHDLYHDQPEAARNFAHAKSAIQGELYTVIKPLPPPPQTVVPPESPAPVRRVNK